MSRKHIQWDLANKSTVFVMLLLANYSKHSEASFSMSSTVSSKVSPFYYLWFHCTWCGYVAIFVTTTDRQNAIALPLAHARGIIRGDVTRYNSHLCCCFECSYYRSSVDSLLTDTLNNRLLPDYGHFSYTSWNLHKYYMWCNRCTWIVDNLQVSDNRRSSMHQVIQLHANNIWQRNARV